MCRSETCISDSSNTSKLSAGFHTLKFSGIWVQYFRYFKPPRTHVPQKARPRFETPRIRHIFSLTYLLPLCTTPHQRNNKSPKTSFKTSIISQTHTYIHTTPIKHTIHNQPNLPPSSKPLSLSLTTPLQRHIPHLITLQLIIRLIMSRIHLILNAILET